MIRDFLMKDIDPSGIPSSPEPVGLQGGPTFPIKREHFSDGWCCKALSPQCNRRHFRSWPHALFLVSRPITKFQNNPTGDMLCLIVEWRDYTLKKIAKISMHIPAETRGTLLGLSLKTFGQSSQNIRLDEQTLIDFRALSLINGLNILGRTWRNGANSCQDGS